jgi:hypothetical protein
LIHYKKKLLWVSLYRAELWRWQFPGRNLMSGRKIKVLQLEPHASSAVGLPCHSRAGVSAAAAAGSAEWAKSPRLSSTATLAFCVFAPKTGRMLSRQRPTNQSVAWEFTQQMQPIRYPNKGSVEYLFYITLGNPDQ